MGLTFEAIIQMVLGKQIIELDRIASLAWELG